MWTLRSGLGVSVFLLSILCCLAVKKNPKPPPCDSAIYCHGPLLKMVQLNHIFSEDKIFVDLPLKYSPEEVLANFETFRKSHTKAPKKADIKKFVDENFILNGEEFEAWTPADWKESPKFLEKIENAELRKWAWTLNGFWKDLGRNISGDVRTRPERYSLLPLTHPFIVPGGRFREVYYWDSYWILRGLLQSEMFDTAKGMIQNFLELVEKNGFVPNGGRIYYQRSQPPMLIQMVKSYFDATLDTEFLQSALPVLEKEFTFWITRRMITIVSDKRRYSAARYCSDRSGPRPEAYSKDYALVKPYKTNTDRQHLYTNIQSAAESGWDFSSRWYIPEDENVPGNNTDTDPCHIIPVDLNALMFLNAQTMTKLYSLAGDLRRSYVFIKYADDFKRTLQKLLWDKDLGSYFDFDRTNHRRITDFYASSFFPLWAGVDNTPSTVNQMLGYWQSQKVFDFPGGIPTSLHNTGQQWDLPNGWAPLNHIAIEALAKSGNPIAKEMAVQIAQKWIGTNYKAFYAQEPNTMFEKYDVTQFGKPGSGGEYTVVAGFGWTNGVVLDLLSQYGSVLSV